jgi:hypothetical protein
MATKKEMYEVITKYNIMVGENHPRGWFCKADSPFRSPMGGDGCEQPAHKCDECIYQTAKRMLDVCNYEEAISNAPLILLPKEKV